MGIVLVGGGVRSGKSRFALDYAAERFERRAFVATAQAGDDKMAERIRRHQSAREQYMGDVLGDLTARRGKIGGMFQRGDVQVIAARVPLAQMFGYATRLRSLTQGRAVYTMQFSKYEELPQSIAEELVNKFQGKAVHR